MIKYSESVKLSLSLFFYFHFLKSCTYSVCYSYVSLRELLLAVDVVLSLLCMESQGNHAQALLCQYSYIFKCLKTSS